MRIIQQYRGLMSGVCMMLVLSGCTTLTKEEGIPDSVLMTKPLQVDLKPDFRSELKPPVPTPAKPMAKTPLAPAKPPLSVAQIKPVIRRSCGNEPVYTLNGRSYKVLPSAQGYREEGLASRYNPRYQGSETAGCEKYDLHAFTAAHRTLPLPSFVRVTNLQSNKAIIVKVNDRGPFDGSGLIQLSSAAAGTLGISPRDGAAKVRVEALSARGGVAGVKRPPVVQQQARAAIAPANRIAKPRTPAQVRRPVSAPARPAAVRKARQTGKSFFVVVKNYESRPDALDMFVRLTSVGLKKTELASASSKGRNVHQVRVGPLYTQDQIDRVKDRLSSNGLATFRVVEVAQ